MMNQYAPIAPEQFRFQFVREIGRGGLGRVDEIVIVEPGGSMLVGARYACKRLNEQFDDHPVYRARFEREINAVKSMSHPGIVSYEGENLPNGQQRFYLMPLYKESLRDRLVRYGKSAWRDVAHFGIRLANALTYAHGMGMIHRDLKPENILFDSAGNAVIADWGLGYFVHRESRVLMPLTMGGMGTEYYCSLEQWSTGKCDARGDIYSLGVVLAELVNGTQVPLVQGLGIRQDVVLDDRSPGASGFNSLLRGMTSMLPQHRPGSMEQVATTLTSLVR
ncbi:MAG: serine/threonine-protein kinase [Polyangiaceae bacterium]